MAVIFCLSHQRGDDLETPVTWWKHFLQNTLHINIAFDKVAHFGIYGILGCAAYWAWPNRGIKAFCVCVLYGLSDEIHQIYVPGRSCDPWDLLADTVGSAVAIILATVLFRFWGRSSGRLE
jgi:VanZ family protein